MAEGGSLASIVVKVTTDASEFLDGMKKCSDTAKQFAEVGAVLVGAGSAITGTFIAMAEGAGKLGAEIELASQRTGLSTEMLSGLKLAAEATGGSLDSISVGFRKLATDAENAAAGQQKAADLFKQLGISATDSSGQVKELDVLFPEVAEALSHVTNSTQLAADATAIFGRGGMALLPILKDGSAGLQEWADKAEEAGVSVTASQGAQALAFEHAQKDAKAALEGFSTSIGQTFLPAMTQLAEGIGGGVIAFRKFVESHEELVKAAAILGVALIGAGGLALGIAAVTAAVGFMLTPMGVAALAIAGVAAAMAEFPKFRETVVTVLKDVTERATAMGSVLGTVFKATYEALTGNLKDAWATLSNVGTKALDDASASGDLFDKSINGISSALDSGKKSFDALIDNLRKTGEGHAVVTEEMKKFADAVNRIVDSVTEETKRGPELVAALEQMTLAHTNESLIIDKLGPKVLAYAEAVIKEGGTLDAVTQYYADLAVSRQVDNDLVGKQWDLALKIGQVTESLTARTKEYAIQLSQNVPDSLKVLDKAWEDHSKTLDEMLAKGLGAARDEAKERIDLINQELQADTTYHEKVQDLALATEQVKKARDDEYTAYLQTILDYQTEMAGAADAVTLSNLKNLSDEQIKAWKEYSDEYVKLTKESSDTATHYSQQFFISTQQAIETMEKSMASAMGGISKGIADGLANSLVHWTDFSDTIVKLGQDTASKMLSSFLTGLMTPLTNELTKLGKQFADWASGALANVNSVTSALSGGSSAAGGAVGTASGSGAGGGFGSVMSGIGLGASIISAGAGIIGDFQNARMEGTLNAIEANTRFTYIDLEIINVQLLQPLMRIVESLVPNGAAGVQSAGIAPAYQNILNQAYEATRFGGVQIQGAQ